MKLDWLADAIRAEGASVTEYPDWKTRTMVSFDLFTPVGLINHHTAPPVPYPVAKLLTKCNITIDPEGVVTVLNAGWAYDSGYGDPLVLQAVRADSALPLKPTDTYLSLDPITPGGSNPGVLGNKWFIDIEVMHPGDGSPLPPKQRDALVKTNAAICKRMGWDPMFRLIGHREWTKRKIDPRWDGAHTNPMPEIRADTKELMTMNEPSSWAKEAWEWGLKNGVLTENSDPKELIPTQNFVVHLKRYDGYVKKVIATATAAVSVSAAQLIAEIVHRLTNG